jgi:hypothetical protein
LDVEKLAQLKNILADLKKGYEVISGGYQTIKNISQGNFNLHQAFLDGLLQVNPMVKNYKRVADIISTQIKIVSEYKKAIRQFTLSQLFTSDELDYLKKVYRGLFNQSLKNLDALTMVITASKLRMSDDERLSAVDDIYLDIEDQLTFLRHFNNQTRLLGLQRAKDENEINVLRKVF